MSQYPELPRVIADFAAMETWHTMDTAENNCGDASYAFRRLCERHGIPCESVFLVGLPDYVARSASWLWRSADPDNDPTEGHVMNLIDDTYYDWTRRQYIADAPYPAIESAEQVVADGWVPYKHREL